ncbi:MAG: 4-(cytidine 5'-diphospho)-2-C-methyl-D-erythritol kinase [Georgfuchsia sp.]
MAARLDWSSDWPAPAKINLFLHVVGRRADGYHLLQTVFRFLDVSDYLRFAPRNDGEIVQNSPLPGVAPGQDLTVRAACALQAASGVRQGVSITLDKRLPLGGGLGGGSSDAATTLLALNHLWQCGLSRTDLGKIGLRLGADVPVFIHGHSAFGEGVGELLTDVNPPPAWYLVLTPAVAVSTAEIFSAAELRRDTPAILPGDWQPGSFGKYGGNGLEAVTCRRYPEVALHLTWLRTLEGASRVAMSGSGACCFAEFGAEAPARMALMRLPHDMRGFVCCGVDVHPLAQM